MAVNYTLDGGMLITVEGTQFNLSSDVLYDKRFVFYTDGVAINVLEVMPNGGAYSLPSGATELLHVIVPCNCLDLISVQGWGIIDMTV